MPVSPPIRPPPSPRLMFVLAVVLVLGLGAVDYLTGPELSFAIFYFLPIGLGTWTVGRRTGFVIAGMSTAAWLAAEVYGGQHYSAQWIHGWNAFTRAGVFCILLNILAGLQASLKAERNLARIDPLTGLANARAFQEAAEREMLRAKRQGTALSVAYVDVDAFKAVNDTFGHSAGDRLLESIGACLRENTRGTDICARLGGDEFGILIPGADLEAARSVAEKLFSALAEVPKGTPYKIGFSMGVVCFRDVPSSVDALIREADALMYEVKFSGKHNVRVELRSEHSHVS